MKLISFSFLFICFILICYLIFATYIRIIFILIILLICFSAISLYPNVSSHCIIILCLNSFLIGIAHPQYLHYLILHLTSFLIKIISKCIFTYLLSLLFIQILIHKFKEIVIQVIQRGILNFWEWRITNWLFFIIIIFNSFVWLFIWTLKYSRMIIF